LNSALRQNAFFTFVYSLPSCTTRNQNVLLSVQVFIPYHAQT
jgi:hypothetical protein